MRYFLVFAVSVLGLSAAGYGVSGMSLSQSADTHREREISQNADARQYPILAVPSSTNRIESVLESEGIYCIYNGTAYGFMTENGKEITSYDYENAYPFSQGLACAARGGKYGFIDKEGRTALPFIYDDSAPFQEGLAYFSSGDQYGFMDKSGNPVFYLDCDSVSSFKEGMAYFCKDGAYGYIDHTGKTVIEPIYEDAGYFQDGFADIMKNGRHGLIDKQGNMIIPPEYDRIERQEGIFVVQSDGSYGCFDATGRELLPVNYDQIFVRDGMITIQKDGKEGLADQKGTILVEPSYQDIQPVPGRPFAVVESNGMWGMVDDRGDDYQGIDHLGSIWRELRYDYMSCSRGQIKNVLTYSYEGRMGCMSIADFSNLVPCKYDQISEFVHDMAVLQLDGKYGVVNTTGVMVLPVVYDRIILFDNGSMTVTKDGRTSLLDSKGKVLNEEKYDSIVQDGDCYEISLGRRIGFLDETGRERIAPSYDSVMPGSGYSEEVKVATCYDPSWQASMIKTGQTGGEDLSKVLLRNKITPRIKPFWEFSLETEGKGNEAAKGMTAEYPQGLDECDIKTYKLYDIDGSGIPVLYFYAEPVNPPPRPMSSSGFYSVKDGKLHKLITGYECGGTLGGDYVRLWYDGKTHKTMIGIQEKYGGFGGNSYGGTVYDYKDGEAVKVCSFNWVNQKAGNYDQETLLEHARLFYDENEKPYTRDSISRADEVIEYTVNGKRAALKEYEKAAGRYR